MPQCSLCVDKDKMLNLIISKCSKLAQKKYKTRHDLVVKVIYRELNKRLNFDHSTKPESVQEN